MDNDEFDQIAAEEWERIPEEFRVKMKNVALLIEDDLDDAARAEEGFEEGDSLLGLYRGIPLTERGSDYGVGMTLPDTITLYRLPILDESLSLDVTPSEAVRTIIRETIWHEVGHYFGHGEEAIGAREDEGSNGFET